MVEDKWCDDDTAINMAYFGHWTDVGDIWQHAGHTLVLRGDTEEIDWGPIIWMGRIRNDY